MKIIKVMSQENIKLNFGKTIGKKKKKEPLDKKVSFPNPTGKVSRSDVERREYYDKNNIDYLETDSFSDSDNDTINNFGRLPAEFTRSKKSNAGVINDMNLEEIFEFEKQQQRINTEKVVTSWTDKREELVNVWIKELEFYQVISYFYLFQVKKIENTWAWLIIVLSAIVSTISLIQFDKDDDDADLVLAINILVTVFTTFITLIAAWMKKQNYVSTISEVEKYLQSLSIVLSELNGQIKIAREDRVEFCKFLEKYKDKVIKFSSSMPLISPYDWKHTVYLLTKYYPELVEDTYPWNENRDFSKLILMTYHKVKYRTCFRRLISGYYCYSSCCKSEEEGVRNIREYFYKKKRIEESKYLNEIEEKYNNMNHTNKDKHSNDDVPINIPNDEPVNSKMNETTI